MEDKIVKENLEYEQKQAEKNLLKWNAYWQEIKEPGCINWGLIKTKKTYRDIKFYENGKIILSKDNPKSGEGLFYEGAFKVYNNNFEIKLYYYKNSYDLTQYIIKREGNWILRSSDDITVADNLKTKEKRITINTRKRASKRKGKVNGTYQVKILEDNINGTFITRRGIKKRLNLADYWTEEKEKKTNQVNQEAIFYLKCISGEIPVEGLSNRVNDYIKDLDNVKVEIPKVFKKAK